MGLVRFIKGTDAEVSLLDTEVMKLINVIYVHTPSSQKELARLCCKSGLCPLVLTRAGLTFKAIS